MPNPNRGHGSRPMTTDEPAARRPFEEPCAMWAIPCPRPTRSLVTCHARVFTLGHHDAPSSSSPIPKWRLRTKGMTSFDRLSERLRLQANRCSTALAGPQGRHGAPEPTSAPPSIHRTPSRSPLSFLNPSPSRSLMVHAILGIRALPFPLCVRTDSQGRMDQAGYWQIKVKDGLRRGNERLGPGRRRSADGTPCGLPDLACSSAAPPRHDRGARRPWHRRSCSAGA